MIDWIMTHPWVSFLSTWLILIGVIGLLWDAAKKKEVWLEEDNDATELDGLQAYEEYRKEDQ